MGTVRGKGYYKGSCAKGVVLGSMLTVSRSRFALGRGVLRFGVEGSDLACRVAV